MLGFGRNVLIAHAKTTTTTIMQNVRHVRTRFVLLPSSTHLLFERFVQYEREGQAAVIEAAQNQKLKAGVNFVIRLFPGYSKLERDAHNAFSCRTIG